MTVQAGGKTTRSGGSPNHLACPFCSSYDVERMFVAPTRTDCCQCTACGARWDEDAISGEYLGRADRSSVLVPRNR